MPEADSFEAAAAIATPRSENKLLDDQADEALGGRSDELLGSPALSVVRRQTRRRRRGARQHSKQQRAKRKDGKARNARNTAASTTAMWRNAREQNVHSYRTAQVNSHTINYF